MSSMNSPVALGLYVASSFALHYSEMDIKKSLSDSWCGIRKLLSLNSLSAEEQKALSKSIGYALFLSYLLTSLSNNRESKRVFKEQINALKEYIDQLNPVSQDKPPSIH